MTPLLLNHLRAQSKNNCIDLSNDDCWGNGGAQDSQVAALAHFDESIGLAYQIYDDLMDTSVIEPVLSKTVAQDVRHSRNSAVSNMDTEKAKKLAMNTLEKGIVVLQKTFITCPALSTIIIAARYLFVDLEKLRNMNFDDNLNYEYKDGFALSSTSFYTNPKNLV